MGILTYLGQSSTEGKYYRTKCFYYWVKGLGYGGGGVILFTKSFGKIN